ncbi:leucine Rich repeat-containing domain protein [Dictyocaulus viviparus]|uniref:Leucine Rich repeat-containing domain protein n=1 Tax=Dictyocaulus viviparus TaxID=29172 RepID=A0A0D8XBD5_DICVI|nr:leucine Rich repeat-containing domain protein [Dictyocaulus viviparus]
MSCQSLSAVELAALSSQLALSKWSGLKTLSIHDTPLISLDRWPTLTYLETFDLSNNSIKDMKWSMSQTIFPSVKKLLLEHNEFTMSDFASATSLRYLNMSRNRISSVQSDSITPMLSVLDLSSSEVRVVEAGAFSHLTRLHSVTFANCRKLIYISPAAFRNISVFSLDISGTVVEAIPPSLLSSITRISVANVPLDCGCFSQQLSASTKTIITDWDNSTCLTRDGQAVGFYNLSIIKLALTKQCRPSAVLPFGHEVVATVGETFKIYCAGTNEDDIVRWTNPSGSIENATHPEFSSGFERLDYFTTTLFEPYKRQRLPKRTVATTEYFLIDVVLYSDAGYYECAIQRGKYIITKKIHLTVLPPDIHLNVTHIGVSSVHLSWNKNLNVQAVDRVALQVNSTSASDFKRVVLLSLHNSYCSYNLINLLPNRIYTICLRWSLTDDGTDIYSICLSERTRRARSFMEDLGVDGIIVICAICIVLFVFFCGKSTYNRYHIQLRTKQQSKMMQSISGQSVLSQRISDGVTFENHQLQMCSSFCDGVNLSSGSLLGVP